MGDLCPHLDPRSAWMGDYYQQGKPVVATPARERRQRARPRDTRSVSKKFSIRWLAKLARTFVRRSKMFPSPPKCERYCTPADTSRWQDNPKGVAGCSPPIYRAEGGKPHGAGGRANGL